MFVDLSGYRRSVSGNLNTGFEFVEMIMVILGDL